MNTLIIQYIATTELRDTNVRKGVLKCLIAGGCILCQAKGCNDTVLFEWCFSCKTRVTHIHPHLGRVRMAGLVRMSFCFLSSCSTLPPASCHRWYTSLILLSPSWSLFAPLSSVGNWSYTYVCLFVGLEWGSECVCGSIPLNTIQAMSVCLSVFFLI